MVLLQVRDAWAITPPLKLVTSVTGIAVVGHPLGKQTAERFTRRVVTRTREYPSFSFAQAN